MLPNTSFSGGMYYSMPQQGYGMSQMYSGVPQQNSGLSPYTQQSPYSGTGNTGSLDVGQLVAAVFQPLVDLLNTAMSGNTGTVPYQTGGSSQFPGSQFSSGQFPGSQYTGSQMPGGQQDPFNIPNSPYPGSMPGMDSYYPGQSGGQGMDESTQALQLLTQNANALALFDADEDGSLNRSELLTFAKTSEQGISPNAKAAAAWLAGDDGKKTFDALDGYGGAKKDQSFDLRALPIVASDPNMAATDSGINNGQDALYALNDKEFIDSVSRKIDGNDRPVIDFTKLEEVSNSEDDTYTDAQKEAAAFILEHDDLKTKLDDNNDGNFYADMIGEVLNTDPSISKIEA
jgi:hypothetical protein